MSAEILLYFFAALAFAVYWMIWSQVLGSGWLPMPEQAIDRSLEKANVRKRDVVFDLGCGDGRVLVKASKRCKRVVGIEIDPIRYLASKFRTRGIDAKILHGNIFGINLREADVIFAYLHQKANKRLAEKIVDECRKGARVVSYWWEMPGLAEMWKDEKSRIYVYRI